MWLVHICPNVGERYGLKLDALAPAEGDGTGQGVVQEVDDITGQSGAALSMSLFMVLVFRAHLGLA